MSADPRPGVPVTPSVTPSGSAADADAIVAFAAHCRRLGLRVPVASTVVLTEALAALTDGSPAVTPDSLRWAARPVLASSRADLALVDLAVDSYFAGTDPRGGAPVPAPPVRLVLDEEDDDGAPAADEDDREPRDEIVVRWSAAEALHHRDFAECSAVERDELDRLIDDLRVRRPQRRSHRHRPSTARTGPLALRPTSPTPSVTAGNPSGCTGPDGSTGSGPSCSSSTSAVRWSPTAGRCCGSGTRSRARVGESRCSRSGPGSRA